MQLAHLHLIFLQCFLVGLSSPTGEWHNSVSRWESAPRCRTRKKNMQNTQIKQGEREVSWSSPAFSTYERWQQTFLGHLPQRLSRTPGTTAPPGLVLSHHLLSRSCLASEGSLWHIDINVSWCAKARAKQALQTCPCRPKQAPMHDPATAQLLPRFPQASPARHPPDKLCAFG